MADRPDNKVIRGFEVPNPRGLNLLDLLTIIAVVALLTLLLRVSLAKQGRTIAEPLNWMRATASRLAENTFAIAFAVADTEPLNRMRAAASRLAENTFAIATAVADNAIAEAPSPVSPAAPAVRTVSVATPIGPTDRIKKKDAKTGARRTRPVVRDIPVAPPSYAPSPWAKSDEVEPTGDSG